MQSLFSIYSSYSSKNQCSLRTRCLANVENVTVLLNPLNSTGLLLISITILTSTSVCPSVRSPSVRPCFRKLTPFPAVISQIVTNKSCLVCVQSKKYAICVTLRPQSDCCRRGKAEVHILNQKTTRSEFQMPSQTAPAEAKPRCVYSVLKPHGQSFITSPESVRSSCVRQYTQDVPAQRVLPSFFKNSILLEVQ